MPGMLRYGRKAVEDYRGSFELRDALGRAACVRPKDDHLSEAIQGS